ncbi:unnamed protein product [Rotaria sp. Silwood1]|nr:unnamed protein product [Rotaria sp. Silwood1]
MDTFFTTALKVSNNSLATGKVHDKTIPEQPSPTDACNYSLVALLTMKESPPAHNYYHHSLANYQISSSYDNFIHISPSKNQTFDKPKYIIQRVPGKLDGFNYNIAFELDESLARFSPPQTSIIINTDFSDMGHVGIPHILHLIGQDYLNTAQSYVSCMSIKNNYEDNQLLTDIESTTIDTL